MIKPCPFCGEKPLFANKKSKYINGIHCVNPLCGMKPYVTVECVSLGETHTYNSVWKAIKVWNQRPLNNKNKS
jgi:hypothetical protein